MNNIKLGDKSKDVTEQIGTIHIASGERGAAMEGNQEDILKSFYFICEAMVYTCTSEQILIDIVKAASNKLKNQKKMCPVCENIEINPNDNFCKICGHKLKN